MEANPADLLVNIHKAPIVQVAGLCKNYGALAALKEVNFEIRGGEIFGLIGPDGAGKTSIFHILSGIMERTAGDVSVLGLAPRDARLQIGYLTQQFSLYPDLSITENISYVAGLRQLPKELWQSRAQTYLELMNLDRFATRLAGRLSGGMKQKLALCCALISRPSLLLLDEPTTGVDPVSRREFWDLLVTVAQQGVTIAVATPYLDEAERCHRILLLHEGVVQQIGTPAELKNSLGGCRLELRSVKLAQVESYLLHRPDLAKFGIFDIQRYGDRLDLLARSEQAARLLLEPESSGQGISVQDISLSVQEPTLENVFVAKLRSGKKEGAGTSFPSPHVKKILPDFSSIEAVHLRKSFGNFHAVDDVSLRIKPGEIYGLLGANGAGKTTTIKMLCGLLMPTSGTVSLCGEKDDLRSAQLRKRLGYMSQKFTLYDDLTIVENLEFYCGVYAVARALQQARIEWVLAETDLSGQEHMLTGLLPGGWKQRLAFGSAVMHEPDVLFLDEPTSGVDPLARRQMWKSIREFASRGAAILVTTHFLEEAEYCNTLGFMVDGKLVVEGAPGVIKSSQKGTLLEMRFADLQGAYDILKSRLDSWRVSIFADTVHLLVDDAQETIAGFEKGGQWESISPLSIREIPFSLEDAFIAIVNRVRQAEAA